jgi:hypothetical protein
MGEPEGAVMLLESPEGRSFSLHVVGYEFPDEVLGPTEDNPADEFERGRFLVVTVSAKTPDGEWQATAAEMTTVELERLADWLETVSNGHPSGLGAYFTERDLEFAVSDDGSALQIHLFSDFLPPQLQSHHYTIDFPIRDVNLEQAVASLRAQLAQFPHDPWPDQSN